MALDEAIVVLTDRQVSMAVVVGSGRVPEGIVTLEDLLEPFMGDIEDEHDATAIPN
jgi:CBS domain containing-hemolysin-like protein